MDLIDFVQLIFEIIISYCKIIQHIIYRSESGQSRTN